MFDREQMHRWAEHHAPHHPFRFAFGPGFPGPGRHGRGGPGHGGPGPFGRGGFPGRLFGRGPQMERGSIRVALLALLNEGPMHGYQMIRELAERSGGAWQPSPGSVYPTLQLLQDEGLVTAADVDGRRVYSITEAGKAAFRERGQEPLPWENAQEAAGDGVADLHALALQVFAAVRQVAHAGNETQLKQAREVLAGTRRSLYRILAEDEPEADTPAGTEL